MKTKKPKSQSLVLQTKTVNFLTKEEQAKLKGGHRNGATTGTIKDTWPTT